MHLVITDSGLGGLSICAGIEQAWRAGAGADCLRITYVNAWPEEGRGYNDLPDVATRAAAFDRALERIDRLAPDRVLIACNTLSILYGSTAHARRGSGTPVQGIIDAGVGLFEQALRADPSAVLVLLGTRTTIESGVHVERLVQRGVPRARVTAASCHGLATAIERGIRSEATRTLIETCTERAAATVTGDGPVLLGLCCTHYAMASGQLVSALARRVRGAVRALDPNEQLVRDVARTFASGTGVPLFAGPAGGGPTTTARIDVISKVGLPEGARANVAAILEPVSPETARALRDYVHAPDLF